MINDEKKPNKQLKNKSIFLIGALLLGIFLSALVSEAQAQYYIKRGDSKESESKSDSKSSKENFYIPPTQNTKTPRRPQAQQTPKQQSPTASALDGLSFEQRSEIRRQQTFLKGLPPCSEKEQAFYQAFNQILYDGMDAYNEQGSSSLSRKHRKQLDEMNALWKKLENPSYSAKVTDLTTRCGLRAARLKAQ